MREQASKERSRDQQQEKKGTEVNTRNWPADVHSRLKNCTSPFN